MIILENKLILKQKISKLIKETNQAIEEKKEVFGLNGISLWNIYQDYLHDISISFPIYNGSKNIIKDNVEIYEILEIDEFRVAAKDDFNQQKNSIINYANNILKKLGV